MEVGFAHLPEGSMDSFEQAFDNATRVADLALKANQDLLKQLRRPEKGLARMEISQR